MSVQVEQYSIGVAKFLQLVHENYHLKPLELVVSLFRQGRTVIALEGLIGVGKSTLCDTLSKELTEFICVLQETISGPLLGLFYSDRPKYAFAFQWGVLQTRKYQLQLALRLPPLQPEKIHTWDRSMVGDYMFALVNYLDGAISEKELEAYQGEIDGSFLEFEKIKWLNYIDSFVWLSDEPDACKRRVEKQRKNPNEMGIPIGYYVALDDMHFAFFKKLMQLKDKDVRVLCWGQYNTVDDALKRMASPLRGSIHEVKTKDNALSKAQELGFACVRLLDSDDAITNEYSSMHNLYQSSDSFISKSSELVDNTVEAILINAGAMHGTHTTLKDPKILGIQVYRNEFKRVVCSYLSHHRTIIFYNETH